MRRFFLQKLRIYVQNAEGIFACFFVRAVRSFFCAEEISFKTPQMRKGSKNGDPILSLSSVRFYRIYRDKIGAPHFWTIYRTICATATAASATVAVR